VGIESLGVAIFLQTGGETMSKFARNPVQYQNYFVDLFCSFWVDGKPRATPRTKAFRKGRHAGVYTPDTADDWKMLVAMAAKPLLPETPLEGPLSVAITFIFPRPKRLCRKKDPTGPIPMPSKPDRDNCEKAILDMLSNIGMWKDDAQVCDGPVRKFYHAIDGKPGAHIAIGIIREQS